MEANHIPLIMQRLDKIVAEDRIRKYSNKLIVKIIVILKIYGVSYRSLRIDWHYINSSIIDMINPYNDSAAVDSSVVKPCKDTTAQGRRKNGKYKVPESSWGYSTMGYEYGRKVHASIDTDSLSVMEWKITTASVYDKNMAVEMIDSVRNYNYILMDAAYDSSDIYDYIFENTHSIPVIDTNRRRGIVQDRLTYNRKLGIVLRKKESSRYKLRWEIERTFSILKKILGMEYIWYIKHRNYDVSIGEIIVAYNCIVMANKITGISGRKIMYIVS